MLLGLGVEAQELVERATAKKARCQGNYTYPAQRGHWTNENEGKQPNSERDTNDSIQGTNVVCHD
jgi:hypothetical protein